MKLLLAATVLVAVPPAAGELKVGDAVPSRAFSEVVWNWDGSAGIQDWRGEPVLVDFWGKN